MPVIQVVRMMIIPNDCSCGWVTSESMDHQVSDMDPQNFPSEKLLHLFLTYRMLIIMPVRVLKLLKHCGDANPLT
jgi:hypothetical protein